jgi:transposase
MSSEKYIGLDVHQATISVAVMDSQGKLIMESILETKGSTILEFLAGLRGALSVTFEEGTWAAWLYDLLKPHVAKLVVCNPRRMAVLKQGNKSDKIDARKLADRLRLNDLKPVYHGETGVRMLRELARSYLTVVKDLSRVMNRLKALYRSWAIPCAGRDVYYTRHRSQWLGKIPEAGSRRRAEQLYQQLDMLQHLRQQARRELLAESRKHTITAKLRQIPSLGPIRSALAVALIQTPHRFRSKRQLWTYSGLGLETRDSGEYHFVKGQVRRRKKQVWIRGLNKDYNHDLKGLFKAAAIRASVLPGPFQDVLPALVGQRHPADHGASDAGAQDSRHYPNAMEERRKLRHRETEVASRLSVSGENLFSISGDSFSGGGRSVLETLGFESEYP